MVERYTKVIVSTRVRLYKNLKTKSSVSLPADPDSICEEIKRVHLQSFIWCNCLKTIIPSIDPDSYGWRFKGCDEISPTWFTGNQLPPSLRNDKQKSQKSEKLTDSATCEQETNVDDNDHHSEMSPAKNKR